MKSYPVLNEASRHEDKLGEWRYSSTLLISALGRDQLPDSRLGLFTVDLVVIMERFNRITSI